MAIKDFEWPWASDETVRELFMGPAGCYGAVQMGPGVALGWGPKISILMPVLAAYTDTPYIRLPPSVLVRRGLT